MKKFISWLDAHAKALQSASAILTCFVAVAALIGVKVQIDASARLQQEQSARDIYREFLALSMNQPKYAVPNYCAIVGTADEPGYEHYVQYMLYTSEQILAVRPDWEPTLDDHLEAHKELICAEKDWTGDTAQVQKLIKGFQAKHCAAFKSRC